MNNNMYKLLKGFWKKQFVSRFVKISSKAWWFGQGRTAIESLKKGFSKVLDFSSWSNGSRTVWFYLLLFFYLSYDSTGSSLGGTNLKIKLQPLTVFIFFIFIPGYFLLFYLNSAKTKKISAKWADLTFFDKLLQSIYYGMLSLTYFIYISVITIGFFLFISFLYLQVVKITPLPDFVAKTYGAFFVSVTSLPLIFQIANTFLRKKITPYSTFNEEPVVIILLGLYLFWNFVLPISLDDTSANLSELLRIIIR